MRFVILFLIVVLVGAAIVFSFYRSSRKEETRGWHQLTSPTNSGTIKVEVVRGSQRFSIAEINPHIEDFEDKLYLAREQAKTKIIALNMEE